MSFAALDHFLRKAAGLESGVPGVVVLVRCGDQVVFHEAYGYSRVVPSRQPMTRETLFDLASLTKPVCTGLLSMLLWQEGAIELDCFLSSWFALPAESAKNRITFRELLCNRSGLPAWKPYYKNYSHLNCPVPGEVVRQKVLEEPLDCPPGTREIYSDLGFMLAGWILEQQTDHSLAELFLHKIAEPLSLPFSGFRGIASSEARGEKEEELSVAATEDCPWRNRILQGEVHDENSYMLGGTAGHAGLFSQAQDLDRIVLEIFRGRRGGSEIFSAEAIRTFLTNPVRESGGTWALGWDTPTPGKSSSGRYFPSDSFGHTGFTGTSLWMDLRREISVVLLTNRIHPKRENLVIRTFRPQVHDLIMEELLPGESRSKGVYVVGTEKQGGGKDKS